jgi:aspartate racemase
MGPLASAEFVRTIYQMSAVEAEQFAPRVLLLSDPSFPDRTDALSSGERGELISRLSTAVGSLAEQGARSIVICCVTIHSVLDELSPALRALVVPLTDVILGAALEIESRQLLLCTKGSRDSSLFQRHALWPAVRERIVLLSVDDQERIHSLIYSIKLNRWSWGAASELIRDLVRRYDCERAIAACTELHIVSRRALDQQDHIPLFDPLGDLAEWVARAMTSEQEGQTECAELLAFSS